MNVAIVRGTLSSEPRVTNLPSGTTVYNYEVVAACREGEPSTVPVAWQDPTRPPRVHAGDEVVVIGGVRRRWFRAGGATQSRTEVLARTVARSGSVRAARELEAVRRELDSE